MKTIARLSKQLFLVTLVSLFFFSCEKDEEISGEGNYIYAIHNLTNLDHEFNIYLDDEYQGKIEARTGKIVDLTNLCNDLPHADSQDNVIVLYHVICGDHILKVEDATTLNILQIEDFTMTENDCVCQPFTMM